MSENLTISKMAKLNNITVQTLRFYDKIGLLKPSVIDSSSGYRYYHITQCAKLDMIQYMKCLGMPLETIKTHLESSDPAGLDSILEQQDRWICSRIDELEEMRKAVRNYRDNINLYIHAPEYGVVHIETLPERQVFAYDTGTNFYHQPMDTWEYMIRGLHAKAHEKHLSPVKLINVGSIMREPHLLQRDFYSSEVFIFVDRDEQSTETFPAGTYLTLYFDDFDKEIDYGNRLLDYAKDHGYSFCGDYICEVIMELPVSSEERKMFIKIQVRVEKD